MSKWQRTVFGMKKDYCHNVDSNRSLFIGNILKIQYFKIRIEKVINFQIETFCLWLIPTSCHI